MKFKIKKMDVLIVLILLLSFSFYFSGKLNVNSSSTDVKKSGKTTVVLHTKSSMDFIGNNINIGDVVIDQDTGINMGVVKNIKKRPEEKYNSSSDGKLILDSRLGYFALTIEVETSGVLSDSGLMISNYNYTIGRTFNISAGISSVENVRAIGFQSEDK